jgi:diaminopimelate decarboxylase
MKPSPVSLFKKVEKAIELFGHISPEQRSELAAKQYSTLPLTHIVDEILGKKERIEQVLNAHSTPCYLLDLENLERSIHRYQEAFRNSLPALRHFYAVKLNHEPTLLKTIFAQGFGADVSSARELLLAKEAGAQTFLFSGPGKTKEELQAAIAYGSAVTINVDNFCELDRLKTVVTAPLNIGVRVSVSEHGAWDKFGIPLEELAQFVNAVKESPLLSLRGIQFHISWNQDSTKYIAAIEKLGAALQNPALAPLCSQLEFIDIGGGFRPYQSEGFFTEDTTEGALISAVQAILEDDTAAEALALPPVLLTEAVTIESYAEAITNALQEYLVPLGNFTFYTEPGRIIVNDAMHVAVSVVDVKNQQCVITDGGTNIVGFERFEFDYFPVINLSNPSRTEREATVYGSLCMPQDYWGKYAFSAEFREGDRIIIPYQGALTYANMNDFIKGRAPVFILNKP